MLYFYFRSRKSIPAKVSIPYM